MVDEGEILKVSQLAYLGFKGDQQQAFVAQFQRILEYFAQLRNAPTGELPVHFSKATLILREDIPGESLSPDEALANAPRREGTYFVAPKIRWARDTSQ